MVPWYLPWPHCFRCYSLACTMYCLSNPGTQVPYPSMGTMLACPSQPTSAILTQEGGGVEKGNHEGSFLLPPSCTPEPTEGSEWGLGAFCATGWGQWLALASILDSCLRYLPGLWEILDQVLGLN